QMTLLGSEKKDLQTRLDQRNSEYKNLEQKLSAANKQIGTLEGDLREKLALLTASNQKASDLERKSDDLTRRTTTLSKQAEELARKLEAMGLSLKAAEQTAALVPGLREDLKKEREKYLSEEAIAKALEKEIARRLEELASANKKLADAQERSRSLERDLTNKDKDLTSTRADLARALTLEEKLAAMQKSRNERIKELLDAQRTIEALRNHGEQRFAGIELTGRHVVFLVDMSGSMELIDENTPAPRKWAEVAATAARIMKSLPELRKYQ